MPPPELGGEGSEEKMVACDGDEADAAEEWGVVGQAGDAEAGEEAEREVEGADEEAGEQVEGAGGGRNAEVGEEPEAAGGEVGSEAGGEAVELGFGEAIEEEVGDDEVVGARGLEGEGVRLMGLEAAGCGGRGGDRALTEKVEHGGAEVDGVGVELRAAREKLGEKAPVPITEQEGSASLEEAREEVEATALEEGAEGEVFEPAVGAGDAVEVGWDGHELGARQREARAEKREQKGESREAKAEKLTQKARSRTAQAECLKKQRSRGEKLRARD